MKLPKVRRRWIVLAIVVALVFTAYRMLDARSMILYYRVVDPQTLMVGTTEGAGAWTRVTSVVETSSTVTITVTSFWVQIGASTEMAYFVESVAHLQQPLAGRAVIDGSTGLSVERANCPPPAFSAPVCP
ncbi:MAG: hypothetical protein ACXWQ6_10315 [Candidatus Limnocylindrales bacterium]